MTTDEKSGRVELPRVLGPLAAFSCVVGSVIGSGIFINPARIAASVPFLGGIAIVWVVGGLFSLAGALALAELSAMLPQAGGPYVYLGAAFGRLPAFLFGWTEFLVIRAGSVATLATGFALYFSALVPPPSGMSLALWEMIVASVAVATVTAINVVGTRVGGGVQVAGTALKIGSLVVMIILPFVLGKASASNLSPVWPQSVKSLDLETLAEGFTAALIGALWAYDGWVNAGSLAEDIENPGRNVPRALIWGMFALIALYLSITLAYHLVLPLDQVIAASKPGSPKIASVFFYQLVGERGSTVIALIVMTSVYIALNGNAMSGPRAYFAMARDGLFPRSLCKIHPRFQTPANAILAQNIWAIALIVIGTLFLLREPPATGLPEWLAAAWKKLHATPLFDVLYGYVIFGGTVFYTLSIASVFVLRKTLPDLPRPYKTWGYPFTPAAYLVASGLLMASMLINNRGESLAGLGIIALGLPAYFFFRWRGQIKPFATEHREDLA
jgi:APA family basic amino acid/polyamine antiporter